MDLAIEIPEDELGVGRLQRNVGRDLRPRGRADPREPHHAGVRQHPPPLRARRPPPGRAPGRKRRPAASRQPLARPAPGSRAAPQERRTARGGGHGVARTGHRYRHGRPGLPDRLAALHRGGAAAHRPRRPLGGRAAQRPPLRHHPRRADRMRRAGARHPPRRARPRWRFPATRSTFWRSRWWPPAPPRISARTSCSTWCAARGPIARSSRADFDAVLTMLSEGIATSRGRAGAYLHRDAVNHRLRGRRGARLTAITSGGAIPDTAQYLVVAEPEGKTVGSLDEDFAVESLAGDVFLLGTTSWRIRRVEAGRVRVEDAHGAAPNIPFWRGEAPGRTRELSRRGLRAARGDRARRRMPVRNAALDGLGRTPGDRLRAGRQAGPRRHAHRHAAWSPNASSTRPAACSW